MSHRVAVPAVRHVCAGVLAIVLTVAGTALAQAPRDTASPAGTAPAGTPARAVAATIADLEALLARRLAAESAEFCAQVGVVDAQGVRRASQCAPGTPWKLADDALLEIGSVSKVFLGVLLADAVLRGELRLDDPLQRFLPADALAPTFNGEPIRLLHLATHISGLPRLPPGYRPADPRDPYSGLTERQLLSGLTATSLERAPGRGYEYSNFGAMLLSYALGRAAGKRFDVLLAERITRPLGMTATTVLVPDSLRSRLAQGHDAAGAAVAPWSGEPSLAGVGMIRSTLEDMLKFVAAQLRPPPGQLGRAILGAQEAQVGGGQRLGLGWHLLGGRDGGTMAFHDGATGGFAAAVAVDRDRGVGAVVLADAQRSLNDLAMHLVDPARDLKQPRPRVALDGALLDEYVGTYEFTAAFTMVVTRRGERLFVQATGQPMLEVFAEARDRIYWTAVDARARFDRDETGRVSGMTFSQGGRSTRALRRP